MSTPPRTLSQSDGVIDNAWPSSYRPLATQTSARMAASPVHVDPLTNCQISGYPSSDGQDPRVSRRAPCEAHRFRGAPPWAHAQRIYRAAREEGARGDTRPRRRCEGASRDRESATSVHGAEHAILRLVSGDPRDA